MDTVRLDCAAASAIKHIDLLLRDIRPHVNGLYGGFYGDLDAKLTGIKWALHLGRGEALT